MQNKKAHIIDHFICAAVFCQPLLLVIEKYMIDIMHIEHATATDYRVLLTAIPMSIALILSFNRRPLLFTSTYSVILTILLISSTIHPETSGILIQEASRFTLPLVVGSALCLICVNDISTIMKTLYWLSYPVAILATVYFISIYLLNKGIQHYDMAFSYALLLPMTIMYNKKESISLAIAFLLFIMVVLLGSRGASVLFILYIFADLYLFNKKMVAPFIVLAIFAFFIAPIIVQQLSMWDIDSRTLTKLLETDRSDHDSGRLDLYQQTISIIDSNFFSGIGLYGDRVYLGAYCHNLFLEIFLDFGCVMGGLLIIYLFFKIVYTYHSCSTRNDKDIFLLFFITLVGQFMVSGSYLCDFEFGIFIGILFVLYNKSRKKVPQNINKENNASLP